MFNRWSFYRLHRQRFFLDVLLSLLIISLLLSLGMREMPLTMRKVERLRAFSDFQSARVSSSEYFAVNGSWPAHEVRHVEDYTGSGREINVVDGAVQLDVRDRHDSSPVSKILSLRPATLTTNEAATVVWVCGNATVPEGMQAAGDNATTLKGGELYAVCR